MNEAGGGCTWHIHVRPELEVSADTSVIVTLLHFCYKMLQKCSPLTSCSHQKCKWAPPAARHSREPCLQVKWPMELATSSRTLRIRCIFWALLSSGTRRGSFPNLVRVRPQAEGNNFVRSFDHVDSKVRPVNGLWGIGETSKRPMVPTSQRSYEGPRAKPLRHVAAGPEARSDATWLWTSTTRLDDGRSLRRFRRRQEDLEKKGQNSAKFSAITSFSAIISGFRKGKTMLWGYQKISKVHMFFVSECDCIIPCAYT